MQKMMMADGIPLDPNDPRLEQFLRLEYEGDLTPGNPAAHMVPPDRECAEAVLNLMFQGTSADFRGYMQSTLMLNLRRRQTGRKSLAVEPLEK